MMDTHKIIGVHLTDRLSEAVEVQKILTTYGDQIKTRLGLHDVESPASQPTGLLILEMVGAETRIDEMMSKLNAIEGVESQKMRFEHPA